MPKFELTIEVEAPTGVDLHALLTTSVHPAFLAAKHKFEMTPGQYMHGPVQIKFLKGVTFTTMPVPQSQQESAEEQPVSRTDGDSMRCGYVICTTSKYGVPHFAKFGELGVEWVEDANDACHFLRKEDAEHAAFGEDCDCIVRHTISDLGKLGLETVPEA